MKKNVLAVLAALTLASCSFTVGESHGSHGTSGTESSIPAQQEFILEEDYGVKTATAASLLTDSISFQSQGPLARRDQMTAEEELEAIDKVHEYLGLMNQILNENPIQTEIGESDRPEYAFKVVVRTFGIDGSTGVFTMYFNANGGGDTSSSEVSSSEEVTSSEELVSSSEEVISSSEEVISSSEEIPSSEEVAPSSESSQEQPLNARKPSGDDDQDEEDEEEEDDEYVCQALECEEDEEDREEIDDEYDVEESETEDLDEEDRDEYEDNREVELGEENEDGEVATISGIAIVGEIEYQLLGFSYTEGEEVKTRYFLLLDEQNWVRISSKDEGGESKYDVLMKANGEVSRISFKVESSEDGETEVSLFIKSEAGAPEMYKFKSEPHEETGGQLVRISARVGGEKFRAVVLIYVDSETGETVYNYRLEGSDNDYFKDGDRDYHDDEHEEEDED
jgi:hypothetical protein